MADQLCPSFVRVTANGRRFPCIRRAGHTGEHRGLAGDARDKWGRAVFCRIEWFPLSAENRSIDEKAVEDSRAGN